MQKKPWLVIGAIGIGAVLAAACGSDDDSNGSGDDGNTSTGGTGSGGTSSNTASGNTNTTTSGPSTTGSPSTTVTTGSTTSGSGGAAGMAGAGGECGEAGAAGMAGAPAAPPSCEEIDSRAFGDDEDFTVSSPDFDNCDPMPAETTCDGKLFPESVSPEVTWTEGPEGTLSYAISFTDVTILTVRDPADPTYNQGYHYVIWDIPADTLTLPANLSSGYQPEEIDGALQWAPFNDYGFMGPCPNMPPPACNPPPLNNDSYSFTVYAMPTATVEIPAAVEGQSFPRYMDNYLRENALAAAEYRGTSDAQASSVEGVFPPVFAVPCPTEGDPPEGCLAAE